jgi:hypothetical protein
MHKWVGMDWEHLVFKFVIDRAKCCLCDFQQMFGRRKKLVDDILGSFAYDVGSMMDVGNIFLPVGCYHAGNLPTNWLVEESLPGKTQERPMRTVLRIDMFP